MDDAKTYTPSAWMKSNTHLQSRVGIYVVRGGHNVVLNGGITL